MLPAYRCLAKAAFGPQFKWGHHSRDGNENCLTPTTTAWYLAPSFARAWFPPPRSGWKQHGLHQLRFHKTGTHSKEIVQLSVLWWFCWWNFTCHNCFIGPFDEKLLFIIYFTNYLVDGKKISWSLWFTIPGVTRVNWGWQVPPRMVQPVGNPSKCYQVLWSPGWHCIDQYKEIWDRCWPTKIKTP